MLELLKGDADADDGADKAKEEEQEELQVGDLLSGGVAQKAAAATTGQGETTESSTGTAPTERGADVDPFEAPLRAEVEDPFLPEADPVGEEEDDEDIFLSQTEEETKREAAIEAAVIREVFGAPDLKSLFAAVTTTNPPSGDAGDDDNDDDHSGASEEVSAVAKKRKRFDEDDDHNDNKREGAEAGEGCDGTQEKALKKTRKEDDAVSATTGAAES